MALTYELKPELFHLEQIIEAWRGRLQHDAATSLARAGDAGGLRRSRLRWTSQLGGACSAAAPSTREQPKKSEGLSLLKSTV